MNAVNPNEMPYSQHEHLAAKTDMNWYYLNATEEIIGPLPESDLRALRDSGNIQNETRVCRDGDGAWSSFAEVFTSQNQDLQAEGDSFKFNCLHCGQNIAATTEVAPNIRVARTGQTSKCFSIRLQTAGGDC